MCKLEARWISGRVSEAVVSVWNRQMVCKGERGPADVNTVYKDSQTK